MTYETLRTAFGRNLRRLRDDRRWTQEEAAQRLVAVGLRWSRSSVVRYEQGARPIDLEDALLVAAAFDVTLAELFSGYGDVVLGDARVPLAAVRDGLTGSPLRVGLDAVPDRTGSPSEVRAALDRLLPITAPDDEAGEAERRAAFRYGLTVDEVLAVAMRRFGRSLSAERDHRIREESKAEAATPLTIPTRDRDAWWQDGVQRLDQRRRLMTKQLIRELAEELGIDLEETN